MKKNSVKLYATNRSKTILELFVHTKAVEKRERKKNCERESRVYKTVVCLHAYVCMRFEHSDVMDIASSERKHDFSELFCHAIYLCVTMFGVVCAGNNSNRQRTIYLSYMCQIKGEDHSLSLALALCLAFDGTNSKFCSRFTFLMDGNFDADNSEAMKRKQWNPESYLL